MTKYSVEQGGLGNQAVGVGGIDVAKDWHYVQWLDTNGRPVGKAFRFANTRAGFEAMWDRRPCDAVRIGMESTGHYWLGLAHWLRAQGAEVVLVQPAHVHRRGEGLALCAMAGRERAACGQSLAVRQYPCGI